MQLQGKKIALRSVIPSDADLLFQWENDKSNWQVSGTNKPFKKTEIIKFIANQKDIYLDKQLRLMICISAAQKKKGRKGEAENGRTVGCIDLFEFDEQNLKAGIGILIDKDHRKNGFGSEALFLLTTYSFQILNLQQLYCNVSVDNAPSLKLFQKHKFTVTEKKKDVCSLELANTAR
jgi:diamine N-acetyltransferase